MMEDLINAVATRYGFRSADFTAVWDGAEFDASRAMHELAIETGDGRRATVQVSPEALQDPWKHLSKIEDAFKQLARRRRARGA